MNDQANGQAFAKILVIGIGNDYRGDDALGLIVARRVKERHLPQTAVLTESGEGTALITAWEQTGAELVILIDAVSSHAAPGTVSRIVVTGQDFSVRERSSSTHGVGVEQAVELGRALGKLPAHLILYTVEGGQFAVGDNLSPQVEYLLDFVVNRVCHEVQSFISGA